MPDDRIRISALPAATTPSDADVLAGVQSGTTKKFSFSTIKSWLQAIFVPLTRTINNKALSSNITLNASDIGAQPTIAVNGILKGDGAGGVSAAVEGTDYGTYSKPSGGIPASDLASGVVPSASTANPAMDGTAAPGSSGAWARGDHVHPSDTSRLPVYGMGENLLRNWYFVGGGTGRGVFPVNQRGQSSYTASDFAIDGFLLGSHTKLTLAATGLSQGYTSETVSAIQQVLDIRAGIILGKAVTLSVLDSNGLHVASATMPNAVPSATTSIINIDLRTDGGTHGRQYRFRCLASGLLQWYWYEYEADTVQTPTIVYAAKLELGTEQTLCHNEGTDANPVWVLNDVPDYEYELYRCMTSTADSTDTYANKSLATEQQLAYVETGTTASRAYAVGEYFCWNGLLYRVTAAISSGGTFTPGTNCEPATVGDALFGQFRRDMLYNPGTTVSVSTDTTVTLSDDYRNYKFVQMVLYNASSATNTTRTILTIPTNDLESRVHYPLAFGTTVGSVSIGVGSTVGTTIRFYASAISPLTLRYIFGLA